MRTPSGSDKGSVIGAGRLRKSKNTEFVWDLSKGGFVKVAVRKAVPLRECSLRELPQHNIIQVVEILTF